MNQQQKLPKDSIIRLQSHINKQIYVHYIGGRRVKGILKSFDTNMNLIMDDCIETIADSTDAYTYNEGRTRQIGLVIGRGPLINYLMSADGLETIENPFQQQ